MDNEGILLRHAVPYLSLFRRFGSIDSIFARARSMGANRPTEDIAFGSFRFTNGLETTVEFNGLGVSKNVRMELYGRRGQMSCHLEHFDESRSLQDQISSFASISQKDYANTSEAKGVSHGHHLAGWMLQSARFERELNKREVKLD